MTTTLNTKRLTDAVGAEIIGLTTDDLRDDQVAEAVLAALEDYGVLVFRELRINPVDQVEFCTRLGEVDYEEGHHEVRGIYRITLDNAKRPNAHLMKGTFQWHMDGCTPLHDEAPQKATMLSAIAVAETGGETEFASTYAAYDALSEAERKHVDSLRVLHTLEASQSKTYPDPTPEQLAKWRARPSKEHPLVWTHATGRKSLVMGAHADHIVGMDIDEGRAVLDDLIIRATDPSVIYRHEWSVGDTVIWDNHGLMHRATPYASNSDREMLRTTVLGSEQIR
ncbi:TauD/TfdA dioxygenase family protein [Nocardia alni]|uniref:TauD/TfdA dioxygenase family protein n=1 Tax=Nocardia alni TaxID=2815723 RepID=UPI001C2311C6|nr:TauD/TfdA family dioxygenase [Nocardia alni]